MYVPIREQVTGAVRPILWVLVCAVGFVLLIACANVANLVLARGLGRGREFAVRAALGAGRFERLRLLLFESLILGLAGGVLGIGLAEMSLAAIRPFLPRVAGGAWIPFIEGIRIDARVLLATVLFSVLTGIIAGILPALHLSRAEIYTALKDEGRTASASGHGVRIRNALVVVETALGCILLTSATLLLASFVRLTRVNPGFQSDHRLAIEITVPPRLREPARQIALYRELLEQVRSSALTWYVPGFTTGWRWGLRTEDRPEVLSIQDTLRVWMRVVSPDFLTTMGIPVLAGRNLSEQDSERSEPVVLLSDTAARRFFPGQNAIGKRIAFGDQSVWRRVVGIAGSVKHLGPGLAPEPEIYVPFTQLAMPASNVWMVMRTSGEYGPLLPAIRRQVASIDASLAVGKVETIDQLLADSTAVERFHAIVVGSFAILALILAVAGLYSVMAFLVSRQTREIGVRMALGAQRSDVVQLFLGRASSLLLLGLAIGVAGGLAVNQMLRSFLFDMSPNAPLAYAVPAGALLLAGLAGALIPAMRAANVDPLTALHHE